MNKRVLSVLYFVASILVLLGNVFLWGRMLEDNIQEVVFVCISLNFLISMFVLGLCRQKRNTFICNVCSHSFPVPERIGAGFQVSTPFSYKEYIFCEKCGKERWCRLVYKDNESL